MGEVTIIEGMPDDQGDKIRVVKVREVTIKPALCSQLGLPVADKIWVERAYYWHDNTAAPYHQAQANCETSLLLKKYCGLATLKTLGEVDVFRSLTLNESEIESENIP